MCAPDNDDVIQALADGSDQPLRVWTLPGGWTGRRRLRHAQAGNAAPEHLATDGVPIRYQSSRRGVLRECLDDLLR